MEKYAFVQKLGQGAYAVVWRARRKSDGRLVAVKQLKQSPETWEACKQLPEVRAAAAISDRRHVVLMLEAVRAGGELFLVFEHMESSLYACAALGQRIEEPQVRWASRRLLAALAAVHAAGLVHCDVKPENILVGADAADPGLAGALKLCDFGQAASLENVSSYVGTRWYRPPELLLDARGGQGVDIWAAGCTLAELVLRRPLFPGSDLRDMLFKISGELGAPDTAEEQSWPLASKFIEASRRTNAPAAAWSSLASAGASEAGVKLLSALLKYDPVRRLKPEKALKEAPFFAKGTPEAPMPLPPARPVSPGTLQRHREEATAVEKRICKAAPAEGVGGGGVGVSSSPLVAGAGPVDEGFGLSRQARAAGGYSRTASAASLQKSDPSKSPVRQNGSVGRGAIGVAAIGITAPHLARGGAAVQAWQAPVIPSPSLPSAAPGKPAAAWTGGGISGSGSARSVGGASPQSPYSPAPMAAHVSSARRPVEACGDMAAPLPKRFSPKHDHSPPRSGSPGDSDDEALAEAFWGAVKSSGAPAAPDALEDRDAEEEEALASKIVADMAERGRARRVRPNAGGGRPPLSSA